MSGRGNGAGDPKIASLEEARRRAAEKAKAERRATARADGGGRGPRSTRDLVVGGTIIAMAAGFLVSLVWPLVKG